MQIFKQYSQQLSKKGWCKNIEKHQSFKSSTDWRYNFDIEHYRKISDDEIINYARAMSQMKALLILIKFIKNAFVKNQYLTLFWGLES